MYVSNMVHFLDEKGNIPKQMPKEACPECEYEGVISEWQKTKWDNRVFH
ncbi:MAG: hypothetical protein WA816_07600 [Bacteroidales bacterium]